MLSCSVALASPTCVPHVKWLHSLLWGPGTRGPANPSIAFRGKPQGQVWATFLHTVVLEAISIVLISHLHGLSTRTTVQQLSVGVSFSNVIIFISAHAMVPWLEIQPFLQSMHKAETTVNCFQDQLFLPPKLCQQQARQQGASSAAEHAFSFSSLPFLCAFLPGSDTSVFLSSSLGGLCGGVTD